MPSKKKTTKKSAGLSTEQKVAVGVGLTATAVAAAGAYFLYGSPNAKKNQRKVKSWMLKAKAEVLEQLENAQEMTEEEFMAVVAGVSGTYSKLKDASGADIAAFKKEMKENWPKIAKQGKEVVHTVQSAVKRKPAKKTNKKPAKKTAKKTTKKPAKKATKKTAKKK